MMKNIKSVFVLTAICMVISVLLAVTNYITAPIIEQNQNAAANEALLEVMPEGKGFEKVDISGYTLPATVTEVYKENSGMGYVVKMVTTGYGSDMVIMCGVNSDGVVTGAVCLSSNETLGKEKTYGENFKDKNNDGVDAVEIISGATKTTEAYKNAVKDALNTAIIMGGGTVDIRTEEEIFLDNLNEALPSGEKKFTQHFFVEVVEGIDAIYVADNNSGYVCVIGEKFVGVDANGNVLGGGADNNEAITTAITTIKSTIFEDVNIDKIDFEFNPNLKPYILKVQKTASGNYVVETKGAGYGIKGGDEYHPASNEYIVVRISMTADGKIIDCVTVSQSETKGLGDACANETFYGQFDGKTKENYTEIDGISGATLTTDGYKQAVLKAFEIVSLIEGGAR